MPSITWSVLVKPLLGLLFVALYTLCVYMKGHADGVQQSFEGQLAAAQAETALVKERADDAVKDATRNAEDKARRDQFFKQADDYLAAFYAQRNNPENPDGTHADRCPDPVLDPAELELFNLGNSPDDFDDRGAVRFPGEVRPEAP